MVGGKTEIAFAAASTCPPPWFIRSQWRPSTLVLMNLTSSSHLHLVRPCTSMSPKALHLVLDCTQLEGTNYSWTGGTQLYPQLSELPSWIVPTRTTTESVRFYYTLLSIRTPLQGIAYIILSNEKHSVTVLCRGN